MAGFPGLSRRYISIRPSSLVSTLSSKSVLRIESLLTAASTYNRSNSLMPASLSLVNTSSSISSATLTMGSLVSGSRMVFANAWSIISSVLIGISLVLSALRRLMALMVKTRPFFTMTSPVLESRTSLLARFPLRKASLNSLK